MFPKPSVSPRCTAPLAQCTPQSEINLGTCHFLLLIISFFSKTHGKRRSTQVLISCILQRIIPLFFFCIFIDVQMITCFDPTAMIYLTVIPPHDLSFFYDSFPFYGFYFHFEIIIDKHLSLSPRNFVHSFYSTLITTLCIIKSNVIFHLLLHYLTLFAQI